jgi:hypothetical protein
MCIEDIKLEPRFLIWSPSKHKETSVGPKGELFRLNSYYRYKFRFRTADQQKKFELIITFLSIKSRILS